MKNKKKYLYSKSFLLSYHLIILSSCILLLSCAGPNSVIKKDYPWDRVKRIGIGSFGSKYKPIKGVEDIFAKFLIQEGFEVIERNKITRILKEQKMSMEGVFVPSPEFVS